MSDSGQASTPKRYERVGPPASVVMFYGTPNRPLPLGTSVVLVDGERLEELSGEEKLWVLRAMTDVLRTSSPEEFTSVAAAAIDGLRFWNASDEERTKLEPVPVNREAENRVQMRIAAAYDKALASLSQSASSEQDLEDQQETLRKAKRGGLCIAAELKPWWTGRTIQDSQLKHPVVSASVTCETRGSERIVSVRLPHNFVQYDKQGTKTLTEKSLKIMSMGILEHISRHLNENSSPSKVYGAFSFEQQSAQSRIRSRAVETMSGRSLASLDPRIRQKWVENLEHHWSRLDELQVATISAPTDDINKNPKAKALFELKMEYSKIINAREWHVDPSVVAKEISALAACASEWMNAEWTDQPPTNFSWSGTKTLENELGSVTLNVQQ